MTLVPVTTIRDEHPTVRRSTFEALADQITEASWALDVQMWGPKYDDRTLSMAIWLYLQGAPTVEKRHDHIAPGDAYGGRIVTRARAEISTRRVAIDLTVATVLLDHRARSADPRTRDLGWEHPRWIGEQTITVYGPGPARVVPGFWPVPS